MSRTRLSAPSKRGPATGSAPRKAAVQARSARTVEAIIEGAARILETLGFEGYTTNAIAKRAGVSIGSLYQYFPNKAAITLALIAREGAILAGDLRQADRIEDGREALERMIEAAVGHQLRRPVLARLLDIEEGRLAVDGDPVVAADLRGRLQSALERASFESPVASETAALDLIGMARGITDMARYQPGLKAVDLRARLRRAVFGYLAFAD